MSFSLALQSLGAVAASMPAEVADGVRAHMVKFFSAGGLFPVPDRYLSAVRGTALRANANLRDVAMEICQEPVTTLRLLARVNGSFYGGAREVLSMQEALHQFGVQQVPDVIGSFAPEATIRQFFRGRGTALVNYVQLLSALSIADSILSENTKLGVHPSVALAVLAGAGIGSLGLALARPNVHAALVTDTLSDERADPSAPWRKALGGDQVLFSTELLRELRLPKKFVQAVEECAPKGPLRARFAAGEPTGGTPSATVAYAALRLAREVVGQSSVTQLSEVVRDLSRKSGFEENCLIRSVQSAFDEQRWYAGLIELPNESTIKRWSDEPGRRVSDRRTPGLMQVGLQPFALELKATLGMPPTPGVFPLAAQSVLTTLYALVFGLGCQRACLFRFDAARNLLINAVSLGKDAPGWRGLLRRAGGDDRMHAVESKAAMSGEPIFVGDGIFDDGWPAVAFPIVWEGQTLGVFYADFEGGDDAEPLETAEQLVLMALAEEWQRVPSHFCEVCSG